ncbi:MAG: protein kinase [Aliishimia sp.]
MGTTQKKAEEAQSYVDELSPGAELLGGQYKIKKFLNAGGFGITYIASNSLERDVVIKECFPSAFCHRSRSIVQVRSRAHTAELKSVVDLFVQEARSLSRMDHPNIVGVHHVFEDNETAYMVLDFVEGRDLLDVLEDPSHGLTADQIKGILRDVLGAVGYIHDQDILHRDISPDNILLDADMRPVLIDFGAAREEATKQSRVLSALRVVKDGYSPQEFYVQGSVQSPSSDLYALGATFYHLIMGETPPNSQARLAAIAAGDDDLYEPLVDRVKGFDRKFLAAIDKSLGILPKDRIQSAQEWLDAMDGSRRKSRVLTKEIPRSSAAAATIAAQQKSSRMVPLLGSVAVIALVAVGALVATGTLEIPGQNAVAQAGNSTPVVAPVAAGQPSKKVEDAVASVEPSVIIAPPRPVAVEAAPKVETPVVTAEVAAPAELKTPVEDTPTETAIADVSIVPEAPAPAEVPQPAETIAAVEFAAPVDLTPSVDVTPSAEIEPEVETTVVAELASPVETSTPIETPTAVETAPAVEAEPTVEPAAAIEFAAPVEITPPVAPAIAAPIEAPVVVELETPVETPAPVSSPVIAEVEAPIETVAPEQDIVTVETAVTPPVAPVKPVQVAEAPVVPAPEPVSDIAPVVSDEIVVAAAQPEVQTPQDVVIVAEEVAPVAVPEPAQILAEVSLDKFVLSPEAQVAPTPTPIPEPSIVTASWTVELPFSNLDDSTKINNVEVIAPAWARRGVEIQAINGIEVSKMSDIAKIVTMSQKPSETGRVPVVFSVLPYGETQTVSQPWQLALVQTTKILNGLEFSARHDGEAWVTKVAAVGGAQTDLKIGDTIVGFVRTSETLTERDSIEKIMTREIEAGTEQYSFAVAREGSIWLASLAYTDPASVPTQ